MIEMLVIRQRACERFKIVATMRKELSQAVNSIVGLQKPNLLHQRALRAADWRDEVTLSEHLRVYVTSGFHAIPIRSSEGNNVLARWQW